MADTDKRDYVAEATAQGWDENYEGDNKVDAQVFVEKGEKIAAIAQSQRNKAQAENVQLNARLARVETQESQGYRQGNSAISRPSADTKHYSSGRLPTPIPSTAAGSAHNLL